MVAGAIVVAGGWVGTATLLSELPPSSARYAITPMIQTASTTAAMMRAAVTYCVPDSRRATGG